MEDEVAAGIPEDAPRLPRPVLINQFWADLTFLHWPIDPDAVAHLYPPGTRPDVFEGRTYVGLLPFDLRYTRVGTAVPLRHFGSFAEINVRLYSVDGAGRHGVLFRSLETERLAVVPVTRVGLGVQYSWAKMSVMRSAGRVCYARPADGRGAACAAASRWPRVRLRNRRRWRSG